MRRWDTATEACRCVEVVSSKFQSMEKIYSWVRHSQLLRISPSFLVDCALNETKRANETWLVVSDHDPYKAYIKSRVPSAQIKVWSLPTLANTKQCSDVQRAVVELWLLSKCRHILMTEWSSFGWLASALSGVHPTVVSASRCYVQPFARPCYYELTHIRQLSCYDYGTMLKEEGCCRYGGFCDGVCLHHDSTSGSHSFYFLLVWPSLPLLKWLMKWTMLLFVLIFVITKTTLKRHRINLIRVYATILKFILIACVVYMNIRCIVWWSMEVL